MGFLFSQYQGLEPEEENQNGNQNLPPTLGGLSGQSRALCSPMWLSAVGRVQLASVPTTFDGKKLRQGQNKWTLNARTKAEALGKAGKLEGDLKALLEGKLIPHKSITVEAAVQEWLEFRSKNALTNTKPKFMGQKLVDWCKKNGVLLLTAITPDQAIRFRMSLPFRTGDSSSLSVHWSVVRRLFQLGGWHAVHSREPDSQY